MRRQVADRGVLAAERAGRVALQPHGAEPRIERIPQQQPARQPFPDPEDELQHLGSLQRAHHARHRAEHAGFRTGGHQPFGRGFGVQAAMAGMRFTLMPTEDRKLPLEAQHGRRDQRPAEQVAGITQQEAGGEIVGAVADDVVGPDDFQGVLTGCLLYTSDAADE